MVYCLFHCQIGIQKYFQINQNFIKLTCKGVCRIVWMERFQIFCRWKLHTNLTITVIIINGSEIRSNKQTFSMFNQASAFTHRTHAHILVHPALILSRQSHEFPFYLIMNGTERCATGQNNHRNRGIWKEHRERCYLFSIKNVSILHKAHSKNKQD